MMSHTPGPWTVERKPIQSRGGSNTAWRIGPFAACIYDDWRAREAGISEAENAANARLVAQAPAMLALLQAFATTDLGYTSVLYDLRTSARALLAAVERRTEG